MQKFKFVLLNNCIKLYTGELGELTYIGVIDFYNDGEYMRFDAVTYNNSLIVESISDRARYYAENCQARGNKQTDQYLISCYMQLMTGDFTQIEDRQL